MRNNHLKVGDVIYWLEFCPESLLNIRKDNIIDIVLDGRKTYYSDGLPVIQTITTDWGDALPGDSPIFLSLVGLKGYIINKSAELLSTEERDLE